MKSIQLGGYNQLALVTTINFDKVITIGDPISQAKIFEAQAADELIFLDLDARNDNRNPIIEIIREASEEIFMPFTVGGGVNNLEDFRLLLSNGADKISINTSAVENPELIIEAAKVFGSSTVVVSIDYRYEDDGNPLVYTNGGNNKTNLSPIKWAIECEKLGAGEILLTCIDLDGTSKGLDNKLTNEVVCSVSIPVITSGGCGLASHFSDGFIDGNADAVSAGTYFSFKDQNPMQTRSHIRNSGIPIRFHN